MLAIITLLKRASPVPHKRWEKPVLPEPTCVPLLQNSKIYWKSGKKAGAFTPAIALQYILTECDVVAPHFASCPSLLWEHLSPSGRTGVGRL